MNKHLKNKLTVTVGMPAYNEQGSIERSILSVLNQYQNDFVLEKILVVSDASEDNTIKIVKNLKKNYSIINLIINKERIGQQLSQNKILRNNKSNVVVIIEADTIMSGSNTLSELVKPFSKDSSIGMSLGHPVSSTPKTFFERVLNNGYELKYRIFSEFKNGINVYSSGGHSIKALSAEFADKLSWPKEVPEDAYTYLRAKELDVVIVRNNNAKALMRNVTNFSDRIKQCSKFQSGKRALLEHFSEEVLISEYSIPFRLSFKHTLVSLINNPFWITLYLLELLSNRIMTIKAKKFNSLYIPYYSSKDL